MKTFGQHSKELEENLRTTSMNFRQNKDPKRALQHAKQLAKKYKIEVNPKGVKPEKKGDVLFRGPAKNLIDFVKKQQEFLSKMAFSESLEESPLNTQSIQGLKIMADRMVRKLSGEGLQRRVQLMTQIGKILGIKVKILPNGKIELK